MKTTYYIISIVLSLLLSSCGQREKRYYLTDADKAMIPYKTGDTIYCRDESGHQKILTVRDISMDWDIWDDYIWDQYQTMSVRTEQNDFGLTLRIFGWNSGDLSQRSIQIIHSSNLQLNVIYNATGDFTTSANPNITPRWFVLDSLSIANRIYYNVAVYQHYDYFDDKTSEVYYNKTHGVLQMNLNEKPVFTLDTVIFSGDR